MRKSLTTIAEVAGMAFVTAGAWMESRPIGLVVGGICLFVIGLVQA